MNAKKGRAPSPAAADRAEIAGAEQRDVHDAVEEASIESFPASDPPAFTPLHIGGPHSVPHEPSRDADG